MNKHLPVLITLLMFGSFSVVSDEVFLICIPMYQAEQSSYIEKHIIKFENPQERRITKAEIYGLDIDLPEYRFSVKGPFSYLVKQTAGKDEIQFHEVYGDNQISNTEESFLNKTSLVFTDPTRITVGLNKRSICSKINKKIFEDELSLYKQREELQEGVERDILQIK